MLRITVYCLLLSACIPNVYSETYTGGTRNDFMRVCYYLPTSYMGPDAVPPSLCTHIIFAFGQIDHTKLVPARSSDTKTYQSLVAKKKANPDLKILLSLQKDFPSVVDASKSERQLFSSNAVKFLRSYNFDGVDFDWEYPKFSQKDNYTDFLQIFRKTVNDEAAKTGLQPLLMSAALANNVAVAKRVYNLPALANVVDFATVMTYDYHVFKKDKDDRTMFDSPLYTVKGDNPTFSVSATIDYYLKQGMPASKTLAGIPAYGRTYTLKSSGSHGLRAPAIAKGAPGPVRHLKGFYSVQDVCTDLRSGGQRVWDDYSQVPYMYKGQQWVTYEDGDSVRGKCLWAQKRGLAGVGVWAIQWDDYNGMCGNGTFPLLNAITKHGNAVN